MGAHHAEMAWLWDEFGAHAREGLNGVFWGVIGRPLPQGVQTTRFGSPMDVKGLGECCSRGGILFIDRTAE